MTHPQADQDVYIVANPDAAADKVFVINSTVVDLSGAQAGDFLEWNGTEFVVTPTSGIIVPTEYLRKDGNLAGLTDVAAARTALGLGSAATHATGDYDAAGAAAAAQAAAIAASQPADSDLTAIAALATTAFGRSLLTQATAVAARNTLGLAVPAAFLPGGVGSWYMNPNVISTATAVQTQDELKVYAMHSGPDGVTLDKFDCYISANGSANSVVRMGVYTLVDQDRPFLWVAGTKWATLTSDLGTVAVSSGAAVQKSITPNSAIVIPANTWFGIGGVDQVAGPASRYTGARTAFSIYGSRFTNGTYVNPGAACLVQTGVTGALGDFTPTGPTTTDCGIGVHRSA